MLVDLMKRTRASFIFAMLFAAVFTVKGLAQRNSSRPVPEGFSYPETLQSTEFVRPVFARSLSGSVHTPFLLPVRHKLPVSEALVERMSAEWHTRLEARLSDSKGRFVFSGLASGTYYLRITKPGYSTLKVRVILKKKSKGVLELPLVFCCVLS